MSPKRIDVNKDGMVDSDDLRLEKEWTELELKEEKAEAQKRVAWVSIISMLVVTLFLFLPVIPDERIKALDNLIGMFYIAQASIVGFYFGATAWMTKK